MGFDLDVLTIDAAREARNIADFVAEEVKKVYRRDGVVVGLSGGVDSAVMAAIAVAIVPVVVAGISPAPVVAVSIRTIVVKSIPSVR